MLTKSKKCQIALAASLIFASSHTLWAQSSSKNISVIGTAYEKSNGKLIPLRQATITVKEYGIVTTSNENGDFTLKNIPSGKVKLTGTYIGKLDIDTVLNIHDNSKLNLVFQDNSFRLENVDVVAKKSNNTVGTSSKISRNALEHLQANSLADAMSLVPGGFTINPDLTEAKQINIRGIARKNNNPTSDLSNAFGTSIIIDGAPVSNNANLQSLNPTISGGSSSMSGGAAPSGGYDVRNIPIQNIESIEVVRGIPSVAYGDITSGAVIVNQKAGRQPLTVEARTNPNLYGITASQGIVLDDQKGALNLGADYTYNTKDPVQSYRFYQRATFNSLYSNQFFNNKLSSNTGLSLNFGKDTRKLNPDDEVTKTKSYGKELGIALNTNGRITVENHWLKNIKYTGRISYTDKESYLQEQNVSATAPYSMTYTDGAVLTNFPGKQFYDKDGKEITNIPAGESDLYAINLPATYIGEYSIFGKELSAFAQASASFFNQIGNTNHRWLLGADFKIDKNYGDGKVFSDTLPPYRSAVFPNASFRKRKYSDIPALQQLGLFAEEDFTTTIADRELNIIAGLRYDLFNGKKSVLSPRLNASFEILPDVFSIRGGIGMLSKAPSLLYLSPENAYFEYININELATTAIPVDERVYMTTTRVFNTENKDLKIARNKKTELGFDLNIGKSMLSVTAFKENLENGYGFGLTTNSFQPVTYNEYKRVNNSAPIYNVTSNPVLAKYYMPNNNKRLDKKGIEFDLNLKRIDAIRTQFNINGAYIEQKSYSNEYTFYDAESGSGANSTNVGLYDPHMAVEYQKSFLTSLRAVHNIPSIGFVVTLTAEVFWNESDWTVYGNDSIPEKYISKTDGKIYDFDPANVNSAEFQNIIRPVARTNEIVESYSPMVNFNINVTKEIKDFLRVSFFANNMFRYYQIAQSDRVKSNYTTRNIPYFFGLNVALKIK